MIPNLKTKNEMKVKIDQIKTYSDARGILFEPIEKDSIARQNNIHIVISKPGAVHGNHYHLNGTETITVMGPSLIRIRENADIFDIEVEPDEVTKLTIPAEVAHAIKNLSDRPRVFVAFNTVEHDPQHPDRVEDVILS